MRRRPGGPTIRDLPSLLRAGDILVANDTRVFPAQLQAAVGKPGSASPSIVREPTVSGMRSPATAAVYELDDPLTIENAPALTARSPTRPRTAASL